MLNTKETYRALQTVYYAVSNLYSLLTAVRYRDVREQDKAVVLTDTKWTRSVITFTALYIVHTSAEVNEVVDTCSWSCCKLWGGSMCNRITGSTVKREGLTCLFFIPGSNVPELY